MSRKIIIIGVVVLAILILAVLAVILFLALLGPAIGNVYENVVDDSENVLDDSAIVGENFLQSLKNADYDNAYVLLHPDVQAEISGPDALEALFPPSTIDSWEYETDSATLTDGEVAVAMTGTLTLVDGRLIDLQILLVRLGDENRVAGYSFKLHED